MQRFAHSCSFRSTPHSLVNGSDLARCLADALVQLFGMLGKQLNLLGHEFALKLNEFLGFPDAHNLVPELEGV